MMLCTALRHIERAILDLRRSDCNARLEIRSTGGGMWFADLVDPGADPHIRTQEATSDKAILALAREILRQEAEG